MSFLAVFDPTSTDWRVDRVALLRAVESEWPEAVVDFSVSQTRALLWRIEVDEEPVEAWLSSSGEFLSIDGQLISAANIAVWFRRLVPPHVHLIFCDDGYNFHVEILSDMEASTLAEEANQ